MRSKVGMGKNVFISHSARDREVAQEIAAFLEQDGISCWIAPRDVTPGRNFGEEILDAIEGTRATVLILSENSNASVHVRHEIERAVSKGRPVFPVRIREVPPSRSLELFISSAQWIDAWVPPLEDAISRLSFALKALLSGEPADVAAANILKSAAKRRRPIGRRAVQGAAALSLAAAAAIGGRFLWMHPSDDTPGIMLTVPEPVGANIYVDGRLLGQSTLQPRHLALSAGEHRLRIQADGYWNYDQSVEVQGTAPEPLTVKLARTNALVVTVTPTDAKIAIDGKAVDRTSAVELRDGQHTVDASAAGYEPYRQVVSLEGGRHQSLVVTLNPVKRGEPDHPAPHPRQASPDEPRLVRRPAQEAVPAAQPTVQTDNSFADSFKRSFGESLGRNLGSSVVSGGGRTGFPMPHP